MRFAAYAGTSVVLAAGTIVRAFFERANFYSAAVLIAQSNACLMILTNVALLGISVIMLAMQRVFYGPLRPIEVEQLYEKAWFAITETCLAMTIFRDEVGGWFLIMFVSLLIGKVWGWIGEGRVEILEQQPPSNPRLFHVQLSLSLLISLIFDALMLRYIINTVLRHARPNMMVMFAFEFAVLAVTSSSTAARYGISVYEAKTIKKQIDARRAQIVRQREEARAQSAPPTELMEPQSSATVDAAEENVESLEIDTPGWEDKGRWLFYLDLATDFLKLMLYLTFFCVLCMFYGMPIHIIRDVALTIRSFYKRITDFVRYRQATRDMNARYPDATSEEIAREDVCIICREEMRPWVQPVNTDRAQAAGNVASGITAVPIDERARSKKLPCGHILHFACLRSWLERQQSCPTCRRPVLVSDLASRGHAANAQQAQHQRTRPGEDIQAQPLAQAGREPVAPPANPPPNIYNFGPLRIAFGTARQGAQGLPAQQIDPSVVPSNRQAAASDSAAAARTGNVLSRSDLQMRVHTHASPAVLAAQLQQIEQHLLQEISSLRLEAEQLYYVRALQGELTRLRTLQSSSILFPDGTSRANPITPAVPLTRGQIFTSGGSPASLGIDTRSIAGLTMPEGWAVLPLRRLHGNRDYGTQEDTSASIYSSSALPPHTINSGPRQPPTGVTSLAARQDLRPPLSNTQQTDNQNDEIDSTIINAASMRAHHNEQHTTLGPSDHPLAPDDGIWSDEMHQHRRSDSPDASRIQYQGPNETLQEHPTALGGSEVGDRGSSLGGEEKYRGNGKGKSTAPSVEEDVDMG